MADGFQCSGGMRFRIVLNLHARDHVRGANPRTRFSRDAFIEMEERPTAACHSNVCNGD